MLIELHVLQNRAPSNLNRDDNGSPKEAFFGGHRIMKPCGRGDRFLEGRLPRPREDPVDLRGSVSG